MKYKLTFSGPVELDLGQAPARFMLEAELIPVSDQPPPPLPPQPPPASGKNYTIRKGDTPARFQSVLDALRPGDLLLLDNDVELAGRHPGPQSLEHHDLGQPDP